MNLHWDVGAEVGVVQRLVRGSWPGAPSPTPGPSAEVHAHVALLPMLRLGPYVSFDVSPIRDLPAREVFEAGLRAKWTPPLFADPWRGWVFAGVGYGRESTGDLTGGIVEVPLGVGLGYRLRPPWQIFIELGGRIAAPVAVVMYDAPACLCGPASVGNDSFALSLSAGVSFDP